MRGKKLHLNGVKVNFILYYTKLLPQELPKAVACAPNTPAGPKA